MAVWCSRWFGLTPCTLEVQPYSSSNLNLAISSCKASAAVISNDSSRLAG